MNFQSGTNRGKVKEGQKRKKIWKSAELIKRRRLPKELKHQVNGSKQTNEKNIKDD